jgi:23S rRNA (uridine2552-2'-O)-methyltransferase
MYERKDAWYRKAKKEGYRSRAAYKLTEIAAAEKLVRAGDCVIDAGAAPGGWSQVLVALVGKRGKVAAVDILPMDPLPAENFLFVQDDVTLPTLPPRLLAFFGRQADAVVSDAAPNTTGISFTDQARSADLVRAVHGLARKTLRKGGTFLAKIFEGAEADAVMRELRGSFDRVRRIRPGATRRESFELYLLATGFKGD